MLIAMRNKGHLLGLGAVCLKGGQGFSQPLRLCLEGLTLLLQICSRIQFLLQMLHFEGLLFKPPCSLRASLLQLLCLPKGKRLSLMANLGTATASQLKC